MLARRTNATGVVLGNNNNNNNNGLLFGIGGGGVAGEQHKQQQQLENGNNKPKRIKLLTAAVNFSDMCGLLGELHLEMHREHPPPGAHY